MTSSTTTGPAVTQTPPFTIFMLLRALPAWLALPRPQRNTIAESAMAHALKEGTVSVRHFDAEAFTAQCSDVAVFETPDLPSFYRAVERLRDSALFTTPYFELVQILPSIENGFRHFEQSEA